MRRTLLAATFFIVSTPLANAETEWSGSLCFTSATPQCTAQGWDASGCFAIRYAPRNVASNGADTELSLFSSSFAVGFKIPTGNPVASTPYTVKIAKVARGGYVYTGGFRLASQTPAAPTAASTTISMTGFFTNWDEIVGCTYGFRAAATLKGP